MPLALLILALAAANAERINELGLVVEMIDGAIEVISVERGSRAELAGLREGDRIVAVRGIAVSSIAELTEELRRLEGIQPLDLVVEEGSRPRFRLDCGASGMIVLGDEATRSAWVGCFGSLPILGPLRVVFGAGYSAIGRQPGTGSDAFTPIAGVELEAPIRALGIISVARAFAGPNFVWHQVRFAVDGRLKAWAVEPWTLAVHAGVRVGFLELAATVQHGPGLGLNTGLFAAGSIPF